MPAPLLQARGLCLRLGGRVLLDGLSFTLGPGLHFVGGGEGRGKTSLLKLLAGRLQPDAGTLQRTATTVCFEDPGDPTDDEVPVRAWLQARRARYPSWDDSSLADDIQSLGLEDHIDKPLYRLSTGSRRKVGLVAALAGGAELTLLDAPFAALDAASCRVLLDRLALAAADRRHAWVLADYERPAGLAGVAWAGHIDLGD